MTHKNLKIRKDLMLLALSMLLPVTVFATGRPSGAQGCPGQLHARIQIGSLRASNELEDREFSTVANSTHERNFVRDRRSGSCLLLQPTGGSSHALPTSRQMYVQVKETRGGGKAVAIEGYTPSARKIFSIRIKIAPGSPLGGLHEAVVYDGSGPTRERLGVAQVYLND